DIGITTHLPGAKALAHITVEQGNRHGHRLFVIGLWLACRRAPPDATRCPTALLNLSPAHGQSQSRLRSADPGHLQILTILGPPSTLIGWQAPASSSIAPRHAQQIAAHK